MRYVILSLSLSLSLSLFSFLCACNTAGPQFRGLTATSVTVDGSTFDVRVRDELAEAIRTNMEYAPRFGLIKDRAARAMALVSGCEVKDVRGDQAQATGVLKCKNRDARPIAQRIVSIGCKPMSIGTPKAKTDGSLEITCDPV